MSPGTVMADRSRSTDVNRFCERLAERLRHQGVPHPRAAAVALTVRGARSQSAEDFARDLGLGLRRLRAIEEGHVATGDLPRSLEEAASTVDGLDWTRLTGS